MATITTTPAPLQGREAGEQSDRQFTLSSKEKKYDRQLRLWAASGQEALENAHILLLNSGPGVVGIEALKNLILPGVGRFTIVDEALVQEQDLGVNFFLAEDSLGKSRAKESCQYLRELNPEVTGQGVQAGIEDFIITSLDPYTLILLIGPAPNNLLQQLSSHSSAHSIPLFYIHSVGFYSHFSVQLPAHFPCVDTHPEPEAVEDLRLLKPWEELMNFMNVKTSDLDKISDHEHGHIPYLLLLLYNLEIWKKSHDGKPPANFQEKKAFKAQVEKGARKISGEGAGENFDEAVKAVNKSLNPPEISSGLREVFEAAECRNPSANSTSFWIIANAIRDFHIRHGVLPLPGAVPDMKAQSADYIQLQNIYKAKARKDLLEVVDKVRATESEIMRDRSIDEREVEAFCKGAASVTLIHGRPLKILTDPAKIDWGGRAKQLGQELNDETSLFALYLGFLAYDYVRYPGSNAGEIHPHKDPISRLEEQSGLKFDKGVFERTDKIAGELKRANGGELHNISALTGGMVAQEVIKVITKQYIPCDNTCVFDGIASKVGVFKV